MRIASIAAILALTFTGSAHAAGEMHAACLQDIKTLCAGIKPGGGAIRECMHVHKEQISEGCKVAIAEKMLSKEPHTNGANGATPSAK